MGNKAPLAQAKKEQESFRGEDETSTQPRDEERSQSRDQTSTQLRKEPRGEDSLRTAHQTLTDSAQGTRGNERPQSGDEKMADLREQCLRAFEDGPKEDAQRLLAQVQQPHPHCVHWTAWHGWHDLCRQLVENYSLSPSDEADIFGGGNMYRPLHVACMRGRVEVVKYLLTLPPVMLTVNEGDGGDGVFRGWSAIEFACRRERLSVLELLLNELSVHMPNHLRSDKFYVLSLLSRRMNWSTEFPVMSYFHVFMAGNTAAGKTTLTAAMLQLDLHSHSRHGGKMVSGVKTLTAGICASQCSGNFWMGFSDVPSAGTKIEIYDMAGHPEYYSSHSAVMESLCLESPAVFVLMVDLTKPEKQLSKEIYKWSNFIGIESRGISFRVIVVGSRKDVLFSQPQLLASKCKFVEDTAKDALEEEHFAGFVALDSRQLSSENIKPFLTLLTQNIESLSTPEEDKMSFSCHLLHAFLKQVADAKAISFGSLQELVSGHDALSPFTEPAMLTSSLRTLADKGLILFVRNKDHLSSSCIIIDKAQLLQEINGTLFAPTPFQEHRQIASNTGIVPVSFLQQTFPHYRDILVSMLTSLQFCHLMDPTLLASIITNLSPESATSDELLYFPALVSAEHPRDLSIAEGFGWCMYCTNRHQCLTQRCQYAILLDSAYKHCLCYRTPPDLEHSNEEFLRKLRRRCTVWMNGIHWMTKEGTEAIVQISEENRCVSLLVSLNQEYPAESLELRSSVIDTIRSKQKEFCSAVKVNEFLITPSELSHVPNHNFSALTVFAMEDVAISVRDKERFVLDTKLEKRISLEHLLHFDPCKALSPTAVQQPFASDKWSEPVPASFFAGKNPLEMAEKAAADLPSSPQSAPSTSSGFSAGGSVGDGGQNGSSTSHPRKPSKGSGEEPSKKPKGCSNESEEDEEAKPFLNPSLLADYIGELEELKDWRRLALKLGFSTKEVKKIKEDNKGQKEDCITEVMDMWLEKGPSSTTAVLIQALEGIKEHTIAARLREGCSSKPGVLPTSPLPHDTLTTEDLLAVEQELGEFSKWKDLGLNLGLSADSLEIIEADQRLTKERVRAVLLKWLRKDYNVDKHGPPSWKALAEAVRPVNRALAIKINDRHS